MRKALVVLACALSAFVFTVGPIVACKPSLSPEAEKAIAAHANGLAECRAEGRDAGSFRAYEACKRDAGIE